MTKQSASPAGMKDFSDALTDPGLKPGAADPDSPFGDRVDHGMGKVPVVAD